MNLGKKLIFQFYLRFVDEWGFFVNKRNYEAYDDVMYERVIQMELAHI